MNLQESIRRIIKEETEPGIFIEYIKSMLEHFKKKDCICDVRVTFDVEDNYYDIYLEFSQEELNDKFSDLYGIRGYISKMQGEVKNTLKSFLPVRNCFIGHYTTPNCESQFGISSPLNPLNESKEKKDFFLKLINNLIQGIKSTNKNICDMWVEYNPQDNDYEIRSSSPIRYYQLHDSGISDLLALIDKTISSWGLNVYVFAPYYVENCEEEIKYLNESKLIKETDLKKNVMNIIKSHGIDLAVTSLGNYESLFRVLNINSPIEFLHLFDDLDVVQSEENPDFILFRYKKGKNMMIYNKKNEDVYINFEEIWKPLLDAGLFNPDIQELTTEWLSNVYNLKGVKPFPLLGRPAIDAI